jgi:hypothetical protein
VVRGRRKGLGPFGFRVTGEIDSSARVDDVDGEGVGFLSWRVEDVLRGIREAWIVPLTKESADEVVILFLYEMQR